MTRRGNDMQVDEECGVLEEVVSPYVADEMSRIAGQSGVAPARRMFEVHGPYACCGSDEAPA